MQSPASLSAHEPSYLRVARRTRAEVGERKPVAYSTLETHREDYTCPRFIKLVGSCESVMFLKQRIFGARMGVTDG